MHKFRYLLISALILLSACASTKISSAREQTEQQELSPWQALEKLKMGNERFLNNTQRKRDLKAQIVSAKKQFPFAVILSCMDSRGSPELIFDQGIGDIFAQRLAGNIVDKDILGGMEFATKITGAKLVVVLGHTSCGAVKGACENVKLGNLTQLLKKIKPSVKQVQKLKAKKDCNDAKTIDEMSYYNVLDALDKIKKESPVLLNLLKAGKIGLVGGLHDLATGRVVFFEDAAWLSH